MRVLQPRVLPELAAVVMRCLRKQPAERFQPAADVVTTLRAIAASGGTAIEPATSATRGAGRWWWLAAVLAALAVHLTRFDYEYAPPAEASTAARRAAQKALELDPASAAALTSLAHLRLHDWDWTGAEHEFRRALDLDPSYVTHHWYALCLTSQGRTEDAVAAMRRARELDPLSLRINGDLGMALHAAGRYDEAIAQERATLELDPGFRGAYWIMGMAYEQKGQLDEAIRSYREALERSPGKDNFMAALAHAYAVAGRADEARALAAELRRMAEREPVSPFFLALVYTGLRDTDEAIAWLEKAHQQRSGSVRYLRGERRLDPLRSDPQFQDLLRRMNLGCPPAGVADPSGPPPRAWTSTWDPDHR